MNVRVEGLSTFYLRDVKAEKPYLKAKVQLFYDYSEDEELMQQLEQKLLMEVRYSVKLMKALFPKSNYSISDVVLINRPVFCRDGTRIVFLPGQDSEVVRRSKFSFATIEMLKSDPVTKLLFLQKPYLERRYSHMIEVIGDSISYLEEKSKDSGLFSEDSRSARLLFKQAALRDQSDLSTGLVVPKSWRSALSTSVESANIFGIRPTLFN